MSSSYSKGKALGAGFGASAEETRQAQALSGQSSVGDFSAARGHIFGPTLSWWAEPANE